MSFPTHQPETPEREIGWLKKTTDSAKAWFSERRRVGLHWLVLLTAIAVLSLDAWFVGLVALAWTHAAPAVKWYYGVGRDTKRNLRWMLSRFGIFAATAGVYLWLGFDEGFDMALILLVLFGIAVRLIQRRDWTLLGAIVIGVLMGGEYGNGVSIGVALFASALVEYERRKAAYAAKQARMANTLQRFVPQPAPAAQGTASVYGTGEYDQPEGVDPYSTGVFVTEARTEDPHGSRTPVPPAYLPETGEKRRRSAEERRPDAADSVRQPKWAATEETTGAYPVLGDLPGGDPRDETGLHTTEFRVPEQDGPPVRRRIVSPPVEDGEQRDG